MATKFNRVRVEDFKTVFDSYFGPFAIFGKAEEFAESLFDKIEEKINAKLGENSSIEDWKRWQRIYTMEEGFSFLYSKSQESLNYIEEHGLEDFVIYLRFFFVYHRNDKIANSCLMDLGCSKKMVEALVELDNELRKAKLLPAEAGDLIFKRVSPFFK
jgi:hypothetical protein